MIVRPLTQDFGWDEHVDLAGAGSPDADAALDGAFAATPFMLDGF
ncbi:MAG TPA: hypothetical protein VK594_10485 [Streptosporangiaceae bacterium]|nr:hypothetical protein [Streptosporangiaceae bacterium]HMI24900.1 hypothetical protein [Streptosporangiaceae bacterium]